MNEMIAKLESGELFSDFDKMVLPIICRATESFYPKIINPRVAGGWVRDHLLGIENNDIDIVVENITADEFGTKILSFDQNYSIVHLSVNPNESISLPVVRIGIGNDTWFDITEINQNNPIEIDAKRRDFTINALYFNIQTSKVEDFVNGIHDLQNNILKMPIDPTESILEDPRRVLRCFRFAARLNFTVDPNLLQAISENVENFAKNSAKGRIGLEISKIMNSENILTAMQLIVATKMFNSIFDPTNTLDFNVEEVLQRVERVQPALTSENRLVLLFAAIYLPLYDPNKTLHTLISITKKLCLPNDLGSTAKKWQKYSFLIQHKMIELNRVSVGRMISELGKEWKNVCYLLNDDESINYFENEIIPFVNQENMDNIWQIPRMMNGKEVSDLLHITTSRNTKEILQYMFDWQLCNPEGSKDDFVASIKAERPEVLH